MVEKLVYSMDTMKVERKVVMRVEKLVVKKVDLMAVKMAGKKVLNLVEQ